MEFILQMMSGILGIILVILIANIEWPEELPARWQEINVPEKAPEGTICWQRLNGYGPAVCNFPK